MSKNSIKRVTLVTSGHLAANPRVVKEADALAEQGFDTVVVGAQYLGLLTPRDRETAAGRRWRYEPVSYQPDVNPVLFRASGLRAWICRKLPQFTWPLGVGVRAFGRITPELAERAAQIPADLYVAHNLAALPAAFYAAVRHGAKLGFDAEDFHSGELPAVPAHRKAIRLARWMERTFLPRCDYLTAASPGIAREYADYRGASPPTTILNVFPLAEAPAALEDACAQPGPSLYWFSQTVGPDRGLEEAVEALGRVSAPVHLYLRGLLADGYREKLLNRARLAGAAERIHFLPLAPPAEMVRLAARHDVGLALEQPVCRNREICVTNKLFTYLLAGVPVIATATEGQKEVCRGLDAAAKLYPPGDCGALAGLIDDMLSNSNQLRRSRETAWKLGRQTFNWDVEKEKFLNVVRKSLGMA